MVELLPADPMFRGLIVAVLGVGFWVGGVAVAHLLWKRMRGPKETPSGTDGNGGGGGEAGSVGTDDGRRG